MKIDFYGQIKTSISIKCNPFQYDRTKHIDMVKEKFEFKVIITSALMKTVPINHCMILKLSRLSAGFLNKSGHKYFQNTLNMSTNTGNKHE